MGKICGPKLATNGEKGRRLARFRLWLVARQRPICRPKLSLQSAASQLSRRQSVGPVSLWQFWTKVGQILEEILDENSAHFLQLCRAGLSQNLSYLVALKWRPKRVEFPSGEPQTSGKI